MGSSEADESPLEPEVYLIPSHSTKIKPPICSDSEIQVFEESGWKIVDNVSGVYYTTSQDEFIGQEFYHEHPLNYPENSTKETPPEVPEGYHLEWENSWKIVETPIPTLEEKLNRLGIDIEELKSLLIN